MRIAPWWRIGSYRAICWSGYLRDIPFFPNTIALPAGEIGIVICAGSGVCEVVAIAVGVGVAVYGAWELGNLIGNAIYRGRRIPPAVGKPKGGLPTGTKPIDQMGWSSDRIHDIKEGVGAGPRDWVGIDPNGNVWTGSPSGQAVNHGPWGGYTSH